jgi:HEAT repeat protein
MGIATTATFVLAAAGVVASAATAMIEMTPRVDPSLDPRVLRIRQDLDAASCGLAKLAATARTAGLCRGARAGRPAAGAAAVGTLEERVNALETALEARTPVRFAGWRSLSPAKGRPEALSSARRAFSAEAYRDVVWAPERPRRVRVHAAEMLKHLGAIEDDDVPALVALVTGADDEDARATAILAFAGVRHPRWRTFLTDVLRDASRGHRPRVAAVVGLVHGGEDPEVRVLLETLAREDPSPPVRRVIEMAMKGRL